jgi:hypothetical protein
MPISAGLLHVHGRSLAGLPRLRLRPSVGTRLIPTAVKERHSRRPQRSRIPRRVRRLHLHAPGLKKSPAGGRETEEQKPLIPLSYLSTKPGRVKPANAQEECQLTRERRRNPRLPEQSVQI